MPCINIYSFKCRKNKKYLDFSVFLKRIELYRFAKMLDESFMDRFVDHLREKNATNTR